ncbi:MAG: MBL fold metallo-hydrolase [Candidatus Sericytochromatia bacterium]
MKIGPYEVFTLETGRFALDGGAMFGVVPKTLWNRAIPADDLNRIPLALRTLLLVGAGRVILVDTGIGDKFPARQQDMFAIDLTQSNLLTSLASHGLQPADITDVILTHLHFDHAGGATRRVGDKLVPTFPNARYWAQQRNWDWAQNPTDKDRASYLKENFDPLMQHGQLTLLQGQCEILPGVSAWLSDGHTMGQQLIRVHDQTHSLIYCADIIPTSAHLGVPWVMGYDLQPLVTMDEKRRLLDQAAAEDWVIVFEHDPYMDACRVVAGEKGVILKESLSLGL